MSHPIIDTDGDIATIRVHVASARALGMTEGGIARLMLDAQALAIVLSRTSATRWTVELVEPAEVTGETITDEQIRALWRLGHIDAAEAMDAAGFDFLTGRFTTGPANATARARCAAVFSTIFGGPPLTWQPRIIEGGATPPAEPPLTWWHVNGGQAEHVIAQWPGDAPGRHRRALFIVGDSGPVFVSGHRPDETTLRELAEDVERWHAAQAADGGHLESARWGARYHA